MQVNFWAKSVAVGGLLVGLLGCSPVAQSGMNMNLLGMPANVTNISELQGRSRSGATVYVRGKVVQQVPLLDARVYSIEDASGRINIWTQGAMPQIGEEITVRGKLQFKSIAVEGQEIGEVYVEEMERLNS
ncbi:MAG: hypothetical protein LRZ84_00025 [Desertifilum sp.]|nr:hypothetical protein [Desertifilum sp.]